MICENCGGQFDQGLAACPYCGTMNYVGAEQEYLDKLEDVREDMAEVRHHPEEAYKTELVRHGRGIKRIFVATALLILSAVLVVWIVSSVSSHGGRTEEERKAQLLWEQDAYAQLDEWYDAGDYDAMAQFQLELYREESPYSLYSWSHYEFLSQYIQYYFYQGTRAYWEAGEKITGYDIGEILFDVAQYQRLKTLDSLLLSKQEVELCDGYIAEETAFLIDELGFSQGELDEIVEKILEDIAKNVSICYDIGDEKEKELYG